MQIMNQQFPTGSIEIFQDLYLQGDPSNFLTVREALIAQAQTPWRHAIQREKILHGMGGDKRGIAFEREATLGIEAAGLVLISSPTGFKIANIIPLEKNQLSQQQYNSILRDFSEKIAEPVCKKLDFRLCITNSIWDINAALPPSTAKALFSFSRAANKSSGASHPLDRKRWFAFIIDAHRLNLDLDVGLLTRWLVEAERWPDDIAYELAGEYEVARALLNQYDEKN